MTLSFTGETGIGDGFETLLEAYDGAKRVMVIASHEALQDHGIDAVRDKARAKYAAGKRDRILVTTSDFDLPFTPH